uniref:Max dimerization protein 3 n=1 Tax=Pogona vitticeps TaxID=103695 RepID=A0A6J0TGW5_9SAUR
MELIASNLQVLLQAAEYVERREREAEHGYASLSPYRGQSISQSQRRRRPRHPPRKALKDLRSVHNELEKHRRAQLRQCLEQLKQQIPISTDQAHYTTLNLLHQARLHMKKLEEQEKRARRLKERLRCEQQNLRQRLEELLAHSNTERPRADSLDCSQFSSERSDSEDAEVDIEGLPFSSNKEDGTADFSTEQEHSYSNVSNFWI